MKKMLVLVLAVLFTVVLSSAAMASTMGVNVNPGFALDVEHDFLSVPDADDTALRLNWGVNDKLYFKFTVTGYDSTDEVDPGNAYALGMRYELFNNFSLVANYKDQDYNWTLDPDESTNKYNLGFRGKVDMGKNFDLVGELTWNHTYDKYDGLESETDHFWELYTQLEAKIGEVAAANLGVDFYDYGKDGTNAVWIFGAEYYIGKATLYFDYYVDAHDNVKDLCAGVEFGF